MRSEASKDFIRIGIDLGGTKIEMIALDQSGSILRQVRIPTPAKDYQDILNEIIKLISKFESDLGVIGVVGIGTPGAISVESGKLKNSNTACLNGKAFKQDLEILLGRSVAVENDANCFTLSEATDGAAAKKQVVFGVILGTGVGGGIVINGEVLRGANQISGEWGHNPLPWADEFELKEASKCYCGKSGCIETWLCGSALSRSYQQLSGGLILSAEDVDVRAEVGDVFAEEALELYYRRLAKALSSVINLLDPEVIVLGGGLSNIEGLYASVPSIWGEYVFSDSVKTKLVSAKFGDASGVRGAAWLP